MSDEEFSSWFDHDGGPCPLTIGTVVILNLEKHKRGTPVVSGSKVLDETPKSFTVLSSVSDGSFSEPNSWEWKYFKRLSPKGFKIAKIVRYRVKKNPSVKLLEQIAQDPPKDLIPDPERKLLEYHPA